MKQTIIIFIVLLGPLAWMAEAQNTATTDSPGGGSNRPPAPPIFMTLDTDHDGIISASEIVKASAALKTLDKNSDGKLTPDEYKPPRPGGSGGPEGLSGPGVSPKTGVSRTPGNEGPRPPKPPIDTVLDTNQDGIISAAEFAKAPALLKTLDKNSDGKLTPDECLPARPKMPTNNQTKG
jgi:hypothetical protein